MVCLAAFRGRCFLVDIVDLQSAEAIDLPHFLGVPFGEIVVDRDDVATFSAPARNGCGHGRGECLALSGSHLDNTSGVQGKRSGDLHPVSLQSNLPGGDFADHGEGPQKILRCIASQAEDVVELFARGAEFRRGHRCEMLLVVQHDVGPAEESGRSRKESLGHTGGGVPCGIESAGQFPTARSLRQHSPGCAGDFAQ